MPRFDGSGPQGQGPMTGRGMGYCASPAGQPRNTSGYYPQAIGSPVASGNYPVRNFPGRGLGLGRGRGRGAGRGRGMSPRGRGRGRW